MGWECRCVCTAGAEFAPERLHALRSSSSFSRPISARSGELDALHARILRNPADSELSLRFARLAEASGTLRWAIAAYERVLMIDPNNVEAQNGLQRVRRALQPAFTLVDRGARRRIRNEPALLPSAQAGRMDRAWIGCFARRTLARRHALAHRGAGGGKLYQRSGDLNYGYVGIDTGPVIDLWAGWSVHPALGAAAAYFNHSYYYSEAAASLTFEGNLQGAYTAVRVRAAYRSFDDFFPFAGRSLCGGARQVRNAECSGRRQRCDLLAMAAVERYFRHGCERACDRDPARRLSGMGRQISSSTRV